MITFSCCIPVRDRNDPKLSDLIDSIRAQDFPQDQIEIIVIDGEECGNPEQAKAMAIRRATGEICAMFCADNFLPCKETFTYIKGLFNVNKMAVGLYSRHYLVAKNDNSLNRYFSFIGGNDLISFYLGKNDRKPYFEFDKDINFEYMIFTGDVPSLGDNGFFYWREKILQADLDHYYPMDCAQDLKNLGMDRFIRVQHNYLWHRTSDNLISFLIKRYKYARDLFSDRADRRWKLIDGKRDKFMLVWFILCTITIIQPLFVSIRGFAKIRDFAWFWHPVICIGFLITYSILALRNWVKHGQFFQVKCPVQA